MIKITMSWRTLTFQWTGRAIALSTICGFNWQTVGCWLRPLGELSRALFREPTIGLRLAKEVFPELLVILFLRRHFFESGRLGQILRYQFHRVMGRLPRAAPR